MRSLKTISCPSTSRRAAAPGGVPVASGLTAALTPTRCCASAVELANPVPTTRDASAAMRSRNRTIAIIAPPLRPIGGPISTKAAL